MSTIQGPPHRDLTLSEIDAERTGGYDAREIEREFAAGGPCRPASPRCDAPSRHAAGQRERRLLQRFGSPVPLGDGRPAEPIRPPLDDTPPTSPPRPAARQIRVARPDRSPLEASAQPIYEHLTHHARVLLRLLDTAGEPLAPAERFWSVAFIDVVHAFDAGGLDRWGAEARLWEAVHELKRWDIAEIIPGQSRALEVLFVSAHEHRVLLAPRVLHTPHAIPLCRLSDGLILNARASLAA